MWIEFLKPTKSRRKVRMTYAEKVAERKRLLREKRTWKKQ